MTKEEWSAKGYRLESRIYQQDDGTFHLFIDWWSGSNGQGRLIKQVKFLNISFEEMLEQLSYPSHLIPRP